MAIPPKAPQPQVADVNYMKIDLFWDDYLERLAEVFNKKEDGRIRVELQMRRPAEVWETIYRGYDKRYSAKNVLPENEYHLRMRFGNAHGWGEFSETPLVVQTTKRPFTGEDIHTQLRRQNEYELRKVLQASQANIEATNEQGFTPLMVAAVSGRANLCEVILDSGADPNNTTESGRTALMLCCYKGKKETAELLIQRGASIELRDRNGSTALHFAADGEQYEAVKVLAHAGANMEADDGRGCTPLIRCCALKNNGNVLVIKQLLKHGAKVNAQDNSGQTALFYAVLNRHDNSVATLCSENADPTIANNEGVTPLKVAEANEYRGIQNSLTEAIKRRQTRSEFEAKSTLK